MKRFHAVVPVAASLAAFVLVLLALLAGRSPGFMEDYDIVTFNTSALGKNLLDREKPEETPTPTTDSLCDKVGGFLGNKCASATAAVGDVVDNVIDELNEIGNEIADKLADKLGIDEFYSLHIMTICEGQFTPNATAPDAGRNVTECTQVFPDSYNVSTLLDQGLRVGPLEITLADLGFADDLQDAVDTLNKVVKAFAILLILSVAFTGLSFLTSTTAFFTPPHRDRTLIVTNVVVSAIAGVLLFFTSLFVTIGVSMATDKINEKGDTVGLVANPGKPYTIITWVAVGLVLLLVFGFWLWQLLRLRKAQGVRRGRTHPRDSEESGAYKTEKRSNKRSLGGVKVPTPWRR